MDNFKIAFISSFSYCFQGLGGGFLHNTLCLCFDKNSQNIKTNLSGQHTIEKNSIGICPTEILPSFHVTMAAIIIPIAIQIIM